MTDRFLTIQEVAEQLQMSTKWVSAHAQGRGVRITGFKLGKCWRFRQSDVDALVLHCQAIADDQAKRKRPRRVA
jgi:predicted DNA-binding transcriptional regulator AlpA